MSKIPEPENTLVAKIDAFHEAMQETQKPRPYMGISSIGHSCDRWLWLQFRWAVKQEFPGRMLRLFRRGQNEEAIAVADLREAGIDIVETGEHQRTVYAGCHVEGNMDGVILSGVPEAPKSKHIWENKTHSKKSFDLLAKDGVEKAKPMHFIQMQCYMFCSKIDRALYEATCKDDDRIYTERVRLDKAIAQHYIERGQRLALEERIPAPISDKPDWYECKMCAAWELCHQTHLTKQVNCRTCAHSTPKKDSTWFCDRWQATIPTSAQYDGCRSHVLHPDLVPWRLLSDKSTGWNATYLIDGKDVVNGEDGYSSTEILAGGPFNDAVVDRVRQAFNGEVRA